jgi:hypothetical protein
MSKGASGRIGGDLAGVRSGVVLPEVDALTASERHATARYRGRKADGLNGGLHTGRHVLGTLGVVLDSKFALRDQAWLPCSAALAPAKAIGLLHWRRPRFQSGRFGLIPLKKSAEMVIDLAANLVA